MAESTACLEEHHGRCEGHADLAPHPCGCRCHVMPATAVAVHARLNLVESVLAEVPGMIDAALHANGFRAGAIRYHLDKIGANIDRLIDQVEGPQPF